MRSRCSTLGEYTLDEQPGAHGFWLGYPFGTAILSYWHDYNIRIVGFLGARNRALNSSRNLPSLSYLDTFITFGLRDATDLIVAGCWLPSRISCLAAKSVLMSSLLADVYKQMYKQWHNAVTARTRV